MDGRRALFPAEDYGGHMRTRWIYGSLKMLMLCAIAAYGVGSANAQAKSEDLADARKDAREATQVLDEMMRKPDDFIPHELLEKAKGIAVFPGVVKGAFIVGARGGHGVVSRRTATGWSVPVFYNIGGASFGAQIGVKKTDYVVLFMNDTTLSNMGEKLEFGGDLSFAAGPVGRTAGAGVTPETAVLTWSRSEGAFIGASLKGADISADNSKNRAVYGMTAEEILRNPARVRTAGLPSEITAFDRTVRSYASNSSARK
jgi:lipid-binding SYLF domain-containing protein